MAERKDLLKTKDILEATGITHQILYRYVTMGLIEELEVRQVKSKKTGQGKSAVGATASGARTSRARASGQRRFPAETIAVIKLIQSLNQSGYTLRDIKDIFFKEGRLRQMRSRLAKTQLKKSKN